MHVGDLGDLSNLWLLERINLIGTSCYEKCQVSISGCEGNNISETQPLSYGR